MFHVPAQWTVWILACDWLIRIGALFWIPARCPPASARSWLLLVGFLPLAGLPLYLAFGHPWLSARRRRRQARASREIRRQQQTLAAMRWHPTTREACPDAPVEAMLARLAERLGDFMPMRGNAITLIDDYQASLDALLQDIATAQRDIHLLYYLMHDDAVGRAFADALLHAAARGVRCRLLVDAIGGKRGLRAYARELEDAGVTVRAMLVRNLPWRRSARLDLRNHRKIAVIDGRVGHIGSQNLACPAFVARHPNREVVARVRGPVVTQLAALFASDWYIETGERLTSNATSFAMQATPAAGAAAGGDSPAQLLPSGPAYPFENARNVVVALVQGARRSVLLATPYFVPDDATLCVLRVAALSGIHVQLVLPRNGNQRITAWAQAACFDALLAAGVRIALYRPGFLHAKHVSVDDDIALVGSINLDLRSFTLNAEAGLLVYDPAVVARLHAIEDGYLQHADALDLAAWRRRPAWHRAMEGIARMADSFL